MSLSPFYLSLFLRFLSSIRSCFFCISRSKNLLAVVLLLLLLGFARVMGGGFSTCVNWTGYYGSVFLER